MKIALRVAAFFLALLTLALWFFGGLNLGRTQTTVPVETVGAGGHAEIVHETRFLPGADFLAAGLGLSAALASASFLTRGGRLRTATE